METFDPQGLNHISEMSPHSVQTQNQEIVERKGLGGEEGKTDNCRIRHDIKERER
jgi:S-adenosylmethionine synthetase